MKTEIKSTTNYNMLEPSELNRDTMLNGRPKDRKLLASMKADGFWSHNPIVVYRKPGNQKLTIAFGHNRYSVAKYLSIPMFYVEAPGPIDPRKDQPRPWQVTDTISAEVKRGNENYLTLAQATKVLGGISARTGIAAILAGDATKNTARSVQDGTFTVVPEGKANLLKVFDVLAALGRVGGKDRFPYMFETRVITLLGLLVTSKEIDIARLCSAILENYDRIHKQSTRMGYVEMLDDIYNRRKNKNRLDIVGEVRRLAIDTKGHGPGTKWLSQ
jgi:hypothetical protein